MGNGNNSILINHNPNHMHNSLFRGNPPFGLSGCGSGTHRAAGVRRTLCHPGLACYGAFFLLSPPPPPPLLLYMHLSIFITICYYSIIIIIVVLWPLLYYLLFLLPPPLSFMASGDVAICVLRCCF